MKDHQTAPPEGWTDQQLWGKYFGDCCVPNRDEGFFTKTYMGVQCDKCGNTEHVPSPANHGIALTLYGHNNLVTWANSEPDSPQKASFREWLKTLVRYNPFEGMTSEEVLEQAFKQASALYETWFSK